MTAANLLLTTCILILFINWACTEDNSNHTLKYVLYWTPYNVAPFYYIGKGQENLIKKKCPVYNCYMTTDRNYFGGDLTKFDAIAFNGRNMNIRDIPHNRSEHQKYIFFNMECPIRFPTCEAVFDGFYNWTSTYKLHSDIPYPYIIIRNKVTNEIVGPKANMQWADLPDVDDKLINKIANKTKLAAWFASNCRSPSRREDYIRELKTAVKPFGHDVDIYGKCGNLDCPRTKRSYCDNMISQDYYFYLSFENSFDEDYVTEKLTRALNYNAVPIVYGGADYSRFLPPGSYIDARKYTPTELAALLHEIVGSPQRYRDFFKWQSVYSYSDPTMSKNICDVCAALNDQHKMETKTVYSNIRDWLLGSNLQRVCNKTKAKQVRKPVSSRLPPIY